MGKDKRKHTAMNILALQLEFDKEVPDNVSGNAEYAELRENLMDIDRLLLESGVEDKTIIFFMDKAQAECPTKPLTYKAKARIQKRAIFALRAFVLRKLSKLSYREFAAMLALAPLYQAFCKINRWVDVRIPGKSKLQADEHVLHESEIKELVNQTLDHVVAESGMDGSLGIEEELDLSNCYFDAFCLETNIHYPADRVLLRDASRTLMLAVEQIRKHNIFNRMVNDSKSFVTKMNKLCIDMTHSARRRKAGKKRRKKCFRKMKTLINTISKHAHKHLEKLRRQWQETDLSESQMLLIVKRIENVLGQLPEAIRQGHERIIGGRLVKNEDKILSLYEDGVNIITRRKAGAETEFGNKASIMEQEQGLIVDYDLCEHGVPGDPQLFKESYDRTRAHFGHIDAAATDRGCASISNSKHIKKHETYDACCPRNVSELSLRMEEEKFREMQKRRGSTEARISILQNFTGGRLRCKGFEHRSQQFGMCVFVHNLWVIARLMREGRLARESLERKRVC